MTGTETQVYNGEPTVLMPIVKVTGVITKQPLRGDLAKYVHGETVRIAKKDFPNVPDFENHWTFNEETGEINGSNLRWIILTNNVLRQKRLWTPGPIEARALESQRVLTNGVYRDLGGITYSSENPNTEVARYFVEQAEIRGWEIPLIVPPRALDLKGNDAKIVLSDDSQVIYGEQARDYISSLNFPGNSGFRGLARGGDGNWGGYYGLRDSRPIGRVDWVCAEGTAQNFEDSVLSEINSLGQQEIERVNQRISRAREAAKQALHE
jgi:hypothetical protein